MKSTVKYLGRMWNVEQVGEDFRLTYAEIPPPNLLGRTLLAKPDAVWECSRDGKAEPMGVIEGSPSLHAYIAAGDAA